MHRAPPRREQVEGATVMLPTLGGFGALGTRPWTIDLMVPELNGRTSLAAAVLGLGGGARPQRASPRQISLRDFEEMDAGS
jgi:hypothetical protein